MLNKNINSISQGWESALWSLKRINHERNSHSLVKNCESLLSLFCKERQELIAHGRSDVKSELLPLLFKKEQQSKEWWEQFALGHITGERQCKTFEKYKVFRANPLFLESDWLESRANQSHCSFYIQSYKSDLLMIALFQRATRANRLLSFFMMSNFERKSEERMNKRTKSQPWYFSLGLLQDISF